MSSGVPNSVDLRSASVLDRWIDDIRRLFATHYGPDAGMVQLRRDDDWCLLADPTEALDAADASSPLVDLWTSLVSSQRDRFGDCATFAALFALALTERAETLVARGLHPTTIRQGYESAFETARTALADAAVERDDSESLTDLLQGVAAGEGLSAHACVDHVVAAVSHDDSSFRPQVLTRNSGDETASEAFPGVLLKKEPETPSNLPLTDACVLLVDERLYVEEEEEDDSHSRTLPGVTAASPEVVTATEETLSDRYERWADAIVAADPDLVVTHKGAAEVIRRRLRGEGITLVHRAKPTDALGRLAASTGASVVSNVDNVSNDDLGTADEVALREFNDLEYVTVRGSTSGPWTLLVRNWTWSAAELAGDATDVLLAVGDRATAERSYLPGAGAVEVDAAGAVRDTSRSIDERQALAVEAYADALEDTVRLLARNLGRDPATSLSLLRSAPRGSGLVGARGEVGDALAAGVLDLTSAKRGAVASATNTALTLLRVDALVATE